VTAKRCRRAKAADGGNTRIGKSGGWTARGEVGVRLVDEFVDLRKGRRIR